MPVYTDSYKGVFDGVNEIDLVPVPPSGKTVVTMVRVVNIDSESITPKIRVHDSTRVNEDDEYLYVSNDFAMEASEYMQIDGVVCVLGAGQKLVGSLDAAITTDNPQWMVVLAREVY